MAVGMFKMFIKQVNTSIKVITIKLIGTEVGIRQVNCIKLASYMNNFL
jgi:hypothetical protein